MKSARAAGIGISAVSPPLLPPEGIVITHKSGGLRLARLFGKLAYHPEGGMALT